MKPRWSVSISAAIARDDLQVGVATKRQQCVVRSTADVLASWRRSHPQPLCELLDISLEILDSIDDVIDRHAASSRAGRTSPTSLSNCAS